MKILAKQRGNGQQNMTDEEKEKMFKKRSESLKGKKRVFTEEHKKNLSISHKGKKLTYQVVSTRKGIPRSPETIQKIKDSHAKRRLLMEKEKE